MEEKDTRSCLDENCKIYDTMIWRILTFNSFMAPSKSDSSTQGNSYQYASMSPRFYKIPESTSTPLCMRKHLKPQTPAFSNGFKWTYMRTSKSQVAKSAGVNDADLITGYDTTPESDVSMALTLGGLAFHIKIFDGCGRGYRIQRHIDQGSDTTGDCSPSPGPETFPCGTTWFIEVYMRAKYRSMRLGI